jgi:hypothetical protein
MATFLGAVEESRIERANRLYRELLNELKAVNDKKSLYAWKKNFYDAIPKISMQHLSDLKAELKKQMPTYTFKFQRF